MYDYFKGTLAFLRTDAAVVECGGVGYRLAVSASTHAKLSPLLGREATLFIDGDMAKLPSPIKHMYVRRGVEPTTLLRYKGENFYEYASSAFF